MQTPSQAKAAGDARWLDSAANVRKVYYGVWVVCAILLAVEILIHKHVETEIEAWFGFHGLFGFVACVALVLAAKLLRKVLMRQEDYYDAG